MQVYSSISWMRLLDHWVGLPIAFLLGLFETRISHLGGKTLPSLPEKSQIVCVKLLGIGTITLLFPVLRALLRKGHSLTVVSLECHRPLFEKFLPEVQFFSIRSNHFVLWDGAKLLLKLRALKPRIVLDFEPTSNLSACLAKFSKAPIRLGTLTVKRTKEKLYTHLLAFKPGDHIQSLFKSYLQTIEPQLVPILTPQSQRIPPKPLKIGIHTEVGALAWQRNWPLEHWTRLIERLSADHEVIVFGLTRPANPIHLKNVTDLRGKTSLPEFLKTIETCNYFIASDSGAAHLAAVSGVPCTVLFGPESPNAFSPIGPYVQCLNTPIHCSPCLSLAGEKQTSCTNNVCMQRISVASVINTIDEWKGELKTHAA